MVLEIGYDSAWIALFHAVCFIVISWLTGSGQYIPLVRWHVLSECFLCLALWLRKSGLVVETKVQHQLPLRLYRHQFGSHDRLQHQSQKMA